MDCFSDHIRSNALVSIWRNNIENIGSFSDHIRSNTLVFAILSILLVEMVSVII